MKAPNYFDRKTRAIWRKYADELQSSGEVQSFEWRYLEFYVHNYSLYLKAVDDLEENGLTRDTNAGKTVCVNPAYKIFVDSQKLMIKYGLLLSKKITLKPVDDDIDGLLD